MKGTISVNPVFTSYNVKKPIIYLRNPLVMWDYHRLYIYDEKTSVKWEGKAIINCTFSHANKILLALCQDSKLYVLTERLQTITKITWDPKYSVAFQLIQELNIFLMLGVSEVEVLKANILTNIKSTKFLSSMKFQVEKVQHYFTKLSWNKGYKYILEENLLLVWSLQDIFFFGLKNLQQKAKIQNLTRKQNAITAVYFNSQYRYTITGLTNGQIKVWRLPLTHSTSHDHLLIHTYIHHVKAVQEIIRGLDERMIISSASDMSVCLWSLQTFEMLRVYDFLGEYSRIYLNTRNSAFALLDGYLGLLTFGKTMSFISEISSEIVFHDKYRTQPSLTFSQPLESIQFTLSSNLGFQIRTEYLVAKDLNKIQVEYIYPPLKAKSIMQIVSSPYVPNQYFYLVQNGELFRLRIKDGSGWIQQSYNIQRCQDVQMHSLNQIPTVVKFLPIIPPEFDSQIIENSLQKQIPKQYDNQLQQYKALKLITIGCKHGTIIFINTDNFERLYARITYHREAIVDIQSMYDSKSGLSYLVSLCTEHYLKVVKLDNNPKLQAKAKVSCITSVYCGPNITIIKGLQNEVAVAYKKGYFEIFRLNKKQQLYALRNLQATDHEEDITVLDYKPNNKLLLTASLDNKIKIWTQYKILLYEVLLDEGLKYAVWTDTLNILVSHNLKLLLLKDIGLELKDNEVDKINNEFLEREDYLEVNLSDFSKQMGNKRKLKQKSASGKICKFAFQTPMINLPQLPKNQKQKIIDDESPKSIKNKQQKQIFRASPIRDLSKKEKRKKIHSLSVSQQPPKPKRKIIPDPDADVLNKHIDQMKQLKKNANDSILPKIKAKSQDSMFDNFMKSKLINKKILTRRDITLNRIIMKNIIKDHFGNDQQVLSNLKLDF